MFSKLAVYTISAFAVLAVATPLPGSHGDVCSTGHAQCCNSVQDASHYPKSFWTKYDLNPASVTGLVGETCSPITVIGGTLASTCKQQAVCYQNNNYGGVVSFGCAPISTL